MNLCRKKGWSVGEYQDFVEKDGEYRVFFLIKNIFPRLREIFTDDKWSIFEETSQKTRSVKYRAFIFEEKPPNELVKILKEDSALSGNVAIYYLSQLTNDEIICEAWNATGDSVFEEFEEFLKKDLRTNLKPMM
jgi:CRISPR/Cas system-associated endonuclease/helicase Cas3